MKNLIAKSLALVTLLAASSAAASTWGANFVTISSMEVSGASNAQYGLIQASATTGSKPACGTDSQIKFSTAGDSGKALLSIANAAFLSGRQIKVRYTGLCDSGTALVDGIFVQ